MSKTVVGLFSTYAKAQQVKQALISEGFESQQVSVVANDDEEMGSTSGHATSSTATGAEGIGERIGSFFRNLTGGDEATHTHYAAGVNEGGALVAVTVEDTRAESVADLLRQHGAREIEGEYAGASYAGTTDRTATTANGEMSIPVVEEELVVGKRTVERGGVRVYSHVTERPVDASVELRDEQIAVERRPVSRVATAADFAAGNQGVIELTALGEEAVVGKTSRVVEEVTIGKRSTEHTEAIHDTVRKTEVEVEQVAADPALKNNY